MSKVAPSSDKLFLEDIRKIIDKAKVRIATSVNSEIVLVYWQVGSRIKKEILREKRAGYGEKIIQKVSVDLTLRYGIGWGKRNIHHFLRFYETFPDIEIVNALRTQLTWTHIRQLTSIDDVLKRDFYIEMCKIERWSTRTLQERIQSMLYERTAISKRPEEIIKKEIESLKNSQQLSPDLVFKDPYFLNFLGLHDNFSEKELEDAIVAELQLFIIEMGSDFAFLARQKRITIDNRDYKIDLLFYHRRLKCLVAIDLKLGEFEAGYKGQMELYLNWLARHELYDGENNPIGLILCCGKNNEHVDLLQLNKSNIRVADYLTILPPKEVLLDKLHRAIAIAKHKLGNQGEVLHP
nr:DUF1016 domain-containing protein [Bacteroidota bacterium]